MTAYLVLSDDENPLVTWSDDYREAEEAAIIHGAAVVALPIVFDRRGRDQEIMADLMGPFNAIESVEVTRTETTSTEWTIPRSGFMAAVLDRLPTTAGRQDRTVVVGLSRDRIDRALGRPTTGDGRPAWPGSDPRPAPLAWSWHESEGGRPWRQCDHCGHRVVPHNGGLACEWCLRQGPADNTGPHTRPRRPEAVQLAAGEGPCTLTLVLCVAGRWACCGAVYGEGHTTRCPERRCPQHGQTVAELDQADDDDVEVAS